MARRFCQAGLTNEQLQNLKSQSATGTAPAKRKHSEGQDEKPKRDQKREKDDKSEKVPKAP